MHTTLFQRIIASLFILYALFSFQSSAQTSVQEQSSPAPGAFAIRAGIGTDPNLGLGIGFGARYAWFGASTTSFEFGADYFYNKSTESNDRQAGGITVTDEEVTKLGVFGVRGNALFNYAPDKGGVYFIVGFGFVVANVQWTEDWTDANGKNTYHDDLDVTSGGNIFNFGIGVSISSAFEARLETPMLFFYNSGNASAFAPTITLSLQYQFR
jgi:hypothetical protein